MILGAWRHLRRHGPRSFWFTSLSVLGYSRLFILRRDLEAAIDTLEPPATIRLAWLRQADRDRYMAFRPDVDDGFVDRELARGKECLAAWDGDRIVSACWASTVAATLLGRSVPVPPGEVYYHDAFTLPGHRGLGIAPALAAAMLRHHRDRGFRSAFRGTVPENLSALNAHGKSGFRVHTLLRAVRFRTWTWHLERPARGRERATASGGISPRRSGRSSS